MSDVSAPLRLSGPTQPRLADAKRLYAWAIGDLVDLGAVLSVPRGPGVVIRGTTSKSGGPARCIR